MVHSTTFEFERSDGTHVEILLDNMKITWDGDGWNEPYSVTAEDWDVVWCAGETWTKVQWMNHGIVSRTCPVEPGDTARLMDAIEKAADDYAVDAEPEYFDDDF